jgi:hypothetical protein
MNVDKSALDKIYARLQERWMLYMVDCTQDNVDEMTVSKMSLHKMLVDKMAIDKRTLDRMIVYKITR